MGSTGNRSIKFILHEVIELKDRIRVCSRRVTPVRRSWHCQEPELGAVAPVCVQCEQEVPRSRTSSRPRRGLCPDSTSQGQIPFLSVKWATTTREVCPVCGIPGLQIMFCQCRLCPKNILLMHEKTNLPCLDFFLLWCVTKNVISKISRTSSTAGTMYIKIDCSAASRLSWLFVAFSSVLFVSKLLSVALVVTSTGSWSSAVEECVAGGSVAVTVDNIGDPSPEPSISEPAKYMRTI